MSTHEYQVIAPYKEAATLPDADIERMTFKQCMEKALEMGLQRFGDRKILAKKCDIHYPHFSEYMAANRKLDRHRLFLFCMFTACDYPQQWLKLAEEKARAEYKRQTAQMIGEYVQQAMGRMAA
jgi:hypothetical protein